LYSYIYFNIQLLTKNKEKMKRVLLFASLFAFSAFWFSCSKDLKDDPPSGADVVSQPVSRLKAATYIHPGLLCNQVDLDRAKARVAAGVQPWKGSWDRLVASQYSQSTYKTYPVETIVRGGDGQNYVNFYRACAAAYQNALRYRIGGTTANGDNARDILNAWATTTKSITGNADRYLAAGIYGYEFAAAVELMRGYPGLNLSACQNLLKNVFYPLNHNFLVNHNDACITNYWANWDLCNMNSILAIGIVCEDQAKIDEAINYFKSGAGNGSITHAVPFIHSSTLGQWQESGRDQGHSMLGIGLMAAFCEMAWNQGYDMYGYDDNRFAKGANYVAQYNLGNTVPFTTYNWGTGQNCAASSQTVIASGSRGQDRPIWDMIYNHYINRKGLTQFSSITAYAARVRPEGGGGDYGTTSGGFDQLGYTTLTNSRDAGTTGGLPAAGTYKLKNRSSGLMIDNYGSTSDGANIIQWESSSSKNQRWILTYVSANVVKLQCITGSKFLDGMGRTSNGSIVAQYANGSSNNQKWTIIDAGSGYYKLKNVATGLCVDIGASPWANNDPVEQWADGTSYNQQWQFVAP
jgi:hypothetical protein